MSGVSLEGG